MVQRVEFIYGSTGEIRSAVINLSNGTDVYVRSAKWIKSIQGVINSLTINR